MAVIFGIDASSYQRSVNWAVVDSTCEFGFEKATEGAGYVNPYWSAAKIDMKARAAATGFIPGAYLFLDAGDGTAQADHFAQAAGDLTGFAIAVDVERSKGNPTLAQAKACVARLRQHYPNHPIGGYIPRWYWSESFGSASLTFVDWLWQSSYVTGAGSPASLYAKVPSSMWAPFGGMTPALLQFTSSASVGGVSGQVDVSAYRGTTAQLRALAVGGTAPTTTPTPTPEDTDMGTVVNIDRSASAAKIHCKAGEWTNLRFDRQWQPSVKGNQRGGDMAVIAGNDSHAYYLRGDAIVHLSKPVAGELRTAQYATKDYKLHEANPSVSFNGSQPQLAVHAGIAKGCHRYVQIRPEVDVDVVYDSFMGEYVQQP